MMPAKHLGGLLQAARKDVKEEGRRVHEEEVKSIIKLLWMHRNASKRASYRKLVNGMSGEEQWAHTKGVAKRWGIEVTGEEDEDDASEEETRNGRLPWETVGGGKKGRGGAGGKEGRQTGQEEERGKKKDAIMGRGKSAGGAVGRHLPRKLSEAANRAVERGLGACPQQNPRGRMGPWSHASGTTTFLSRTRSSRTLLGWLW